MGRFPKRLSLLPKILPVATGEIPFGLLYSKKRRTLAIQVCENGDLKVYAPAILSELKIREYLNKKIDWIISKRAKALERVGFFQGITYDDGSEFLFLGKAHVLRVLRGDYNKPHIHFDGQMWHLSLSEEVDSQGARRLARQALMRWYEQEAKEIFGGRIFHFSRLMQAQFLKVTIRAQKNIWGSCHPHKRAINLNWRLVMAPLSVIDYVVVHELAHLFFPNHSKKFWNKVKSILPEFKKEQAWLKAHHHQMVFP